ncbi:54S ribosomal protein-like protein [Emericellopsis cladophorae]|uniref:54S ribosomal protein-like protein n=1 Tax=Emericellopsis cladophorae TaxID=2686198 RepID=A0A9Q0BDC1_9HYPO|nr:54S ribosomal protein-like protein [Emericellopsis cladophorae]KAI6780395.1 54S ribosomal protein-like protein [Emericellopsis cladophorae]
MRTLGVRWNKLRRLINLQTGPGAAIIPPNVTRVHMDFAVTCKGGHMGPKKFWREVLPRLKYHNPSIPMIVNRHRQNEIPPKMTIYVRNPDVPEPSEPQSLQQPPSSHAGLSKAQPPLPTEKTIELDMKDKHSSYILEYFVAETRAQVLKPTPEQVQEIQSLQDLAKQGEYDRGVLDKLRAEKKREKDMLARARQAGGLSED